LREGKKGRGKQGKLRYVLHLSHPHPCPPPSRGRRLMGSTDELVEGISQAAHGSRQCPQEKPP